MFAAELVVELVPVDVLVLVDAVEPVEVEGVEVDEDVDDETLVTIVVLL
jgi:hypothetical protein